ncbi:MAG: hypothetical protein QOF77_1956 [Solirubrobacteraceae bacterium]|jgi:hypothetical protein|nr:hypothetical protein [Solirubrobacteraceae bacterium]
MKILLDPVELRGTAQELRSSEGEIGGISRQLLSGGFSGMPPDVIAHVAATLAGSEVRLAWHRVRLVAQASDLDRRAAFAEDPSAFSTSRQMFDFLDRAGLLHHNSGPLPHSARGWFDLLKHGNEGVNRAAGWLEHPGYLTLGKASKLWHESGGAPLLDRVAAFAKRVPGYMDHQGRWVVGELQLRKLASLDTVRRVKAVTGVAGKALGVVGSALDAFDAFGQDQHHGGSVTHSVEHAAIIGGSGAAGSVLGATAGAALGTFICPGVGTAIGGVVGSAAGGWAGKEIGKGAEALLHHFKLF